MFCHKYVIRAETMSTQFHVLVVLSAGVCFEPNYILRLTILSATSAYRSDGSVTYFTGKSTYGPFYHCKNILSD